MNFFKKLFNNNQVNIQDVFNALDSFDNDIKTLRTFFEIAFKYFGSKWKFNLEMYISSLPKEDKEHYFDKFKNVVEYEKALSIWTSALQIIKGVKPVSAELLKSMPEYKMYLLKFGIEGERLFEKLNSMFDIANKGNSAPEVEVATAKDSAYDEAENTNLDENVGAANEIVSEDKQEELHSEKIEENDSVISDDTEEDDDNDEVDDDSEDADSEIVLSEEKQEYRNKLKERILQKVRDIELRKKTLKEELEKKSTENLETEEKDEIVEIKEVENQKYSKSQKTKSIKSKNQSIGEVNTDWILQNFKRIEEFLAESREIMSAISIYKNTSSIEEYKNYSFIIDVIDYLIEKGEKILSVKTDEEIKKVFKGGKQELRDIIENYKKEKNSEILLP